MKQAVIRESQSCTGDTAFTAEICLVEIPKNNQKRVRVFSLRAGNPVSQVPLCLAHAGLRWYVHADQNKGGKLPWSSSSSILLGRERTFARCNAGSGVQNPRFRSLTSAPARFPRLRLLQAPQRAAAPPTKISKKVSGSVKSGSRGVERCGSVRCDRHKGLTWEWMGARGLALRLRHASASLPRPKREIHSAEEHELHIPEEEGRRSSHRSSTSKIRCLSGPAAEDRLRDHVIHWPDAHAHREGGTCTGESTPLGTGIQEVTRSSSSQSHSSDRC
ncbi:unnamed protein product [Pleuronectes platessa]|uniref:Uncharacterized protein n=1 Tax=Pleuronectes platessa TaxID=8262 RepID=A0A9N7YA38_PLEPL|nr:unnamed protein product [Pleuronectes platessa]